MRLNKAQKAHFLANVAEGLESDEINKRAEKFKPPYSVLRSQVTYYRNKLGMQIEQLKEQDETSALKTGLARKEERVSALKELAEKMFADLRGDKLWLGMSKGIGSGDDYQRFDYKEFNRAEVDALRGCLDDIAAEVGDRVRKADLTTNGKELGQALNLKDMNGEQLATLEEALRIVELAKHHKDTAQPG